MAISNRLRIERLLEQGRALGRSETLPFNLHESGTVVSASEHEAAKIDRQPRSTATERRSSRLGTVEMVDVDNEGDLEDGNLMAPRTSELEDEDSENEHHRHVDK